MTNQEAFDKMMKHLRSLKERSMNPQGGCCYNGYKCAVGALMTEEEQEKFGDCEDNVEGLLGEMEMEGHDSVLHTFDCDLLDEMQSLHDNYYNWDDKGFTAEETAEHIAARFKLTYTKP